MSEVRGNINIFFAGLYEQVYKIASSFFKFSWNLSRRNTNFIRTWAGAMYDLVGAEEKKEKNFLFFSTQSTHSSPQSHAEFLLLRDY